MLEYTMVTLFLVSFSGVPFFVELYVRRREPRYLFLLAFGWLAYSISFGCFWLNAHTNAPAYGALFGWLQLLGIALMIAGAFSYFLEIPAKAVALWIASLSAVLLVVLLVTPGAAPYVIVAENAFVWLAAVFGLLNRRRFIRIGGSSYYWLLAAAVVGVVAAGLWLPHANEAALSPPVGPWLGTTASIIVLLLFMVHLEHNAALATLSAQQDELVDHRENLERIVAARTSELKSANAAKSAFLANVSHELRTPLNSIIGFSGILAMGQAGPLSEEQQTQIEMVHRSGRQLLTLIDDVLDLSKIEAGHVELKLTEFDPAVLVREVTESLRPLADAAGLALTADGPADGGVPLRSDEGRVRQVLQNLIGNAIKFTESGKVSVDIERDRDNGLVVAVHDTGPGISSHDLPRVFDVFIQLEEWGSPKPKGTGLGLAISLQYASMLGGDIVVTSERGVGSRFVLTVPDAGRVAD